MKTLLLTHVFATAAMAAALPQNMPFQAQISGHGRPVILIPGLSSSGETWDTTVARYKDRFECHVLTVAGFAGVPRVPGPVLEKVREGLAEYIRANKLVKPVIIGHSMGGYLALDFAARYPDVPGRIVIVDSYPFFAGLSDPKTTPEQARAMADGMRKFMSSQTQEQYEAYVKSGVSTRGMVEKQSDFERLTAWGLTSDRTAVTDALTELYAADLREDLARIKCPTTLFAEWYAFKEYTDRARLEAMARAQYAKLNGIDIRITDKARHFIMWDDPDWMFAQLDEILTTKK